MTGESEYDRLLDAACAHLEKLKRRGKRRIPVSLDLLEDLSRPAPDSAFPPEPPPASERSVPKPAPVRAPEPKPVETPNPPASLIPPGKELNPDERKAAMEELRNRAMACQKCPHLASTRQNVVFGVGDIFSPLMFVGEAPGAEEDEQAEPFVGKAGQLLTRIIETMGMTRQTVYIANILKCRPDTPGQRYGNRKPRPEEMATCSPYLQAQIDLIQPKVIVALGATAIEGLLGKTQGITRIRGQWHEYRNTPLMPTYHPAFLLRNQALAVKRQVWEDMLEVMRKLELPITPKQQGYFLPKQ